MPIVNPNHCFFDSFSLKKAIATMVVSINPPPFTIGKKIALFITPDKYKLILFASAIQMPLTTAIIKVEDFTEKEIDFGIFLA